MKKRVKLRSFFIGIIFVMLFAALITRVYWVQAIEAPALVEKAMKMWEENKEIAPVRGMILDRNSNVLAQDGPSYTVTVNPFLIDQENTVDVVVAKLAEFLDMNNPKGITKLRAIVTQKNQQGEFYRHREIRNEGWKIDIGMANKIKAWKKAEAIEGVHLLENSKRYYPSGKLASHVLGFQNKEGEPVMGLEARYDDILSGTPGRISYQSDLKGTPLSTGTYLPAVNGKTLRLTIDQNIQLYMEQAMENVYEKYQPKSMTAIAVNPNTMEILGLANLPDFNPEHYWDIEDYGNLYNHSVGSQYEPGSVFKIVTLAAAVEEGMFHPQDTYMSGRIEIEGTSTVIHDHNNGRGWGEITYLEGLLRSSNVAFVKLGFEDLGADKLRQYIDKFGYGEATGVDLPGEANGKTEILRSSEIAAATFGQGITATPMQQIASVAAIANGGQLLQPYIVKDILDTETQQVIESRQPQVVRRVISEQTANTVSGYLEQVLSNPEGTGHLAYLQEYPIAGKTGTAQKVVDGEYSDEAYVLSFAGFAPVNDPKLALLVIVDEPDLDGDYRNGGPVIAPLFKEIMQKSLRYLGVAEQQREDIMIGGHDAPIMPKLENMSVYGAKNEMSKKNIAFTLLGEGDRVVKQYPRASKALSPGEQVYIITEAVGQLKLPNLTGKSMRDALQLCGVLELECSSSGSGYVVDQQLNPDNEVWELYLQPLSETRPLNNENEKSLQEDRESELTAPAGS